MAIFFHRVIPYQVDMFLLFVDAIATKVVRQIAYIKYSIDNYALVSEPFIRLQGIIYNFLAHSVHCFVTILGTYLYIRCHGSISMSADRDY